MPDAATESLKDLVDVLSHYLLRAHADGRRVVLVVDEAQNLAPEVLEQVRLLTNLETNTQKLLQIILIGQPELRELLARNELRQLAQRVTGRYHLHPLSAGRDRGICAPSPARRRRDDGHLQRIWHSRELYHLSGGVPRVINVVAIAPCSARTTQDRHRVTGALCGTRLPKCSGGGMRRAGCRGWAAAAAALVLAATLWGLWPLGHPRAPATTAPAAAIGAVSERAAAKESAPAALHAGPRRGGRRDAFFTGPSHAA